MPSPDPEADPARRPAAERTGAAAADRDGGGRAGGGRAEGGEAPLAGLSVCLAGAGKVGSSLAHWAVARGATLAAVGVHRDRGPAEALVAALAAERAAPAAAGAPGGRIVPLDALSTAGHDLLLVAVADPALDAVVETLSAQPQAAVALHVAGARGASALAPLAARGSAVGTLHPLKAFPHVLPALAEARGVMFAVDGDPAAVALASAMASAWGGVPRRVAESDRDLYHLGATLAAGGVVTLLAAAERVARAAGLPPEVLDGYLALARGAVAKAGEELAAAGTFAPAITGPAARGDAETVTRQLATLAELSPELADLAARVARHALAALDEAGVEETPGRAELRRRLDAAAGGARGDREPPSC